jgi:hypothetical protein
LQRIVRRCLAKEPDKRYQSIKEVAIELEELQQELRTNAELEQSVQPQPNGERQQTSGALAGVASGSQLTAGPEVAEVRTVSSAEYVSGAIKHHKTATVVGGGGRAGGITAVGLGVVKNFFW